MSEASDSKYMRRAIDLAKAGEGWVHPNPLVGAVIVKDGRIIGEGYHRKYGELHAERNAIAALSEPAEGATIYVTLEPCCHHGKTPPCTEAIIENGISRVVIGSRDPNPLVAGKGARILREAGIQVEEDFLREECDALNPVFFHYISTGKPYVIMKYAMTADGKIATKTGASKWITREEARQEVHRIRHACMGIMAGIGTVLADDPLLNCRLDSPSGSHGSDGSAGPGESSSPAGEAAQATEPRQPIRIICDSSLRIPADSQICRTANEYETIVACAFPQLPEGELTGDHPAGFDLREHGEEAGVKIRRLHQMGITILNLPAEDGRVDLGKLMEELGARSIDSILLEGGGGLNESALRQGIVSEVRAFIAPKIFGGRAKSPVEGTGVELPEQATGLQLIEVQYFGEDLCLRYRVDAEQADAK